MTRDVVSVFRSAISNADGTVNAGYLALFVVTMIVLGAVPSVLALAAVQMGFQHQIDLTQVGVAIGAVCGGFATVLAALGVFLRGDRAPAPTVVAPPSPQIGQQVVNMADDSAPTAASAAAKKAAKR